MKKLLVLVAMVAMATSAALAENFAGKTVTSVADFSSSGESGFSFILKNFGETGEKQAIEWDLSAVQLAHSADQNWHNAKTYAEIDANGMTKKGQAIYMFTTNMLNGSEYCKAISSGTSGLYCRAAGKNIPMVYQSTTTLYENRTAWTVTTETSGDWKPTDGTTRYISDFETVTMTTQEDDEKLYAQIANYKGIVGNLVDKTSTYEIGKVGRMYFSGKFNNIIGGEKYGTEQLHIVLAAE